MVVRCFFVPFPKQYLTDVSRPVDISASLPLTSTSASIVKFSALAQELLIEGTSFSFAPRDRRIGLLHSCVSIGLSLLDTVIDGFARKGVMPMIEDAHSVAVASAAVRLLRFSSYLDTPARSEILRKLTRGGCEREFWANVGFSLIHPRYILSQLWSCAVKPHEEIMAHNRRT
jgi:hypothetical protein